MPCDGHRLACARRRMPCDGHAARRPATRPMPSARRVGVTVRRLRWSWGARPATRVSVGSSLRSTRGPGGGVSGTFRTLGRVLFSGSHIGGPSVQLLQWRSVPSPVDELVMCRWLDADSSRTYPSILSSATLPRPPRVLLAGARLPDWEGFWICQGRGWAMVCLSTKIRNFLLSLLSTSYLKRLTFLKDRGTPKNSAPERS